MTQVSLITTIYNGAQHLPGLVANVRSQDLETFEWVIVDDGSDDRSADLVEGLTADLTRISVRLIRSPRIGRSAALNLAVRRARGQFIANQDADDLSEPGRLRIQLERMGAEPELGVLGGRYLVRDERTGDVFVRHVPETHEALVRRLAICVPFAHTVAMFRTQAWADAGGYPDVQAMIDHHLWIGIAARGWRLGACPDLLGTHHKHGDSYWTRMFAYRIQQRMLAAAQHRAVSELGLPLWMHGFPLSRRLYSRLPPAFRLTLRRRTGLAAEVDRPDAISAARP